MSHRWDAGTYDRVALPMTRWGAEVQARLSLRGDERVLDAGCGTGRVTEMLLERLPQGDVVALDASPEMLHEASRRLGRFGPRVTFVQADLGRTLPITEPVDAILSTATFHWVLDQDALYSGLAAVLRPGGWLVAQCGGAGNIRDVLEVVAGIGDGWPGDFRFETPEATAERLRTSGFDEVETWLTDEPTTFPPGRAFEDYLEAVCLRQQVARLLPDERRKYVRLVAARLRRPRVDYVRLNILARRTSPLGRPQDPPRSPVAMSPFAAGGTAGDPARTSEVRDGDRAGQRDSGRPLAVDDAERDLAVHDVPG